MKIFKRETEGIQERFVVANLEHAGMNETELELIREFNMLQIHEFTILHQRNPIKEDEDNFESEHLRLEVEYRNKLLRIFACNDIDKYIKSMDSSQESMTKKGEISEIVDSLRDILPHATLLTKKQEGKP